MAKFICEFDSVTKEASVLVDGVPMANVVGFNMGSSWDDDDEFMCDIVTRTKDEANDMVTIQRVMASEVPNAEKADNFPGLFVQSKAKASAPPSPANVLDLSSLFGPKS